MCFSCAPTVLTKLAAEPDAYDLVSISEGLFYRTLRPGPAGSVAAYFHHTLVKQVEVSAAVYNAAKYRGLGGPYQDGESVAFLPSGNTLRCHYHDNVVREFRPVGSVVRALPASVDPGMGFYALTVDGDGHLWVADPAMHRVACYAVDGRTLGNVGSSEELEPNEFDHPEDVVVYDDSYLFVSDLGHQRVAVVDTRTRTCGTYRTFDQPVWEYRRCLSREVVRLNEGLYLL